MEGDGQSDESVAVRDDEWPYDPGWVELAASPLEQLRRAVLSDRLRALGRYPAAPTKRPTIAP